MGGARVGTTFPSDAFLAFEGVASTTLYWVSASQLEVEVGSATAFRPGGNVTLLGGQIKSACDEESDEARCECRRYANESTVAADAPVDAAAPEIVIQGPSTVAVCDPGGLLLDAAQSSGSGGRAMDFVWNASGRVVASANATASALANAHAVLASAVARASDESQFGVTSAELGLLVEGGVFHLSVSLRLSNFLGASARSGVVAVELSMLTLPTVEIIGGSYHAIKRADVLSIEATGLATACDGTAVAERQVSFVWALFESDDDGGGARRRLSRIPTSLESVASNPRWFKLDAFSLEVQTTYLLTVMAVDIALGLNNTYAAWIAVGSGDVVALIDGGDRTVSTDETVVISAAESYDEDEEDLDLAAALTFRWNCTSPLGASVAGSWSAATTSELQFRRELGVGAFEFEVEVTSADGRSASSRVVLTVLSSAPPSCRASAVARPLNLAHKQTFTATVGPPANGSVAATALGRLNSTWSLVQGELVGGITLAAASRVELAASSVFSLSGAFSSERSHNLVLRPYVLVAGGIYVFKLEAVSDLTLSTGQASVTVTASRPPSSGVAFVSPASGVALATRFVLWTELWAADQLPLRYAYRTDTVVLRTASIDPRARDVSLPAGAPNVTIRCFALDSVDAVGVAVRSVRVGESGLSGAALTNATDAALAEAFALDSLDAVCGVAAAAAVAAQNDSTVTDTLIAALGRAALAYVDVDDSQSIEQVAAALVGPVSSPKALSVPGATSALALAHSLATSLVNAGLGRGESTSADSTALVLSSLLESSLFFGNAADSFTERRLNSQKASAADVLIEAVDSLAVAHLATLVADEEAIGVDAPNLKSANRRLSSSSGASADARRVETATMNSSATVETDDGESVEYAASLVEFAIDPHAVAWEGAEGVRGGVRPTLAILARFSFFFKTFAFLENSRSRYAHRPNRRTHRSHKT